MIDKFVAVLMRIAAFVAAGFEHSIANMYFLPLGTILDAANIFGGSVRVALVYYVIYRHPARVGKP